MLLLAFCKVFLKFNWMSRFISGKGKYAVDDYNGIRIPGIRYFFYSCPNKKNKNWKKVQQKPVPFLLTVSCPCGFLFVLQTSLGVKNTIQNNVLLRNKVVLRGFFEGLGFFFKAFTKMNPKVETKVK